MIKHTHTYECTGRAGLSGTFLANMMTAGQTLKEFEEVVLSWITVLGILGELLVQYNIYSKSSGENNIPSL